MPKGKGYKKGRKSKSKHRPVGGMAGNAWSRLRERGRQTDSAVDNAQRTLQERDMPRD